MHGEDPVAFQMIPIIPVAFARQEMHRNCIAAEGIDREHIELPALAEVFFPFHRDPCVSKYDVYPGQTVFLVAEISIGKLQDVRIDLIKADVIPHLSVGSDGSSP